MKKTLVLILVALANLLYAGGPASAATGTLDTTFSGDGYVTIPHLPFTTDTGEAVVAQEDGKIVTVGRRSNEDTGALETLALRYQEDGTPDPAFGGGDGLVSVPMGGPSQGYDVALLSDGRIVVAGEADVDPDNIDWDFAVALLTTSGDLDPNFGNGGVAIIHLGEDMDVAYGVAVDPSDRIVVVGDTWAPKARRFGVVRLDASGTPDAAFSNDGIQRVAVGKSGPALDVAIQSDGKIVVVGQPSGRFGVARLLDDGSLDDTFSGDGTTTTSANPATYAARAVAVQPDGKIVVVGGYTDFYVARYRANGRLDTTFGGDGLVRTNFSSESEDLPWDVAIDSNGKIVVVGHTYPPSPSAIAIARYRTNGALDPTFSGDGKKTSLKGFFAYGAALDADGRLLVVGLSPYFTARYLLS